MDLIVRTLVMSGVIFGVSSVMPGIKIKNFLTAVKVAVVYSLIHLLLFKVLVILTLPLSFLTLGLFTLVIQAGLLWLTDQIIEDFEIDNFGTTFLAALVISVLNWVLFKLI
ncbi:phage holin family protein [Acanthopleuribacter pedis]|uniref:Phage holin family protein n=1 Tax=Acanthopleuribacter pedis TaxID=442870 RepID=A0A8J7QBA0_9BACT|nr:phage holin family protein [Acanthopleuribacter pedis]MBO1321282.1 phage holin family protein [Acanthopleuribacter pedis]